MKKIVVFLRVYFFVVREFPYKCIPPSGGREGREPKGVPKPQENSRVLEPSLT
jgi:hypothetical protein